MASPNEKVKIFLTGATGYIGGTVFSKLLETGEWDITVLTRSENTLQKFRELGVTPLLGSLDDADLLTKAAVDADVTMHLADADHLPAVKALIKGLSAGGKRRIFINCSGTGEISDDARGEFSSDKIYSDLDIETIHTIPATQAHRHVDSYIFDNNQGFESIIVAPPTVYGLGTGPFNRLSVQVPSLIRRYLKQGYAAVVGQGLNIWSQIHVEDLAEFFVFILQKALEGKAATGREGWYFCENGEEYYFKDLYGKIGDALYTRKLIDQAEPSVQFKPEEVEA